MRVWAWCGWGRVSPLKGFGAFRRRWGRHTRGRVLVKDGARGRWEWWLLGGKVVRLWASGGIRGQIVGRLDRYVRRRCRTWVRGSLHRWWWGLSAWDAQFRSALCRMHVKGLGRGGHRNGRRGCPRLVRARAWSLAVATLLRLGGKAGTRRGMGEGGVGTGGGPARAGRPSWNRFSEPWGAAPPADRPREGAASS